MKNKFDRPYKIISAIAVIILGVWIIGKILFRPVHMVALCQPQQVLRECSVYPAYTSYDNGDGQVFVYQVFVSTQKSIDFHSDCEVLSLGSECTDPQTQQKWTVVPLVSHVNIFFWQNPALTIPHWF